MVSGYVGPGNWVQDVGAGLGAECEGVEIMVRDVVLTWVRG